MSGQDLRDRNKAGLNIVKWDLREQPLRPLPPAPGAAGGGGGAGGGEGAGGGGFGGGGNNAPFVLPGVYKATLSVNGRDAQTIDVTVKGDPEIQISDADRKMWHDTAADLHQVQARANEAAEMVQTAYAQFTMLQQQTRGATLAPNVKQSLDALGKEFEVVRRRLGLGGGGGGGGGFGGNAENVRGRIGQLKGAIMGSTSTPTTTQLMQVREVKAALPHRHRSGERDGRRSCQRSRKELLGSGALFPTIKPVQKG